MSFTPRNLVRFGLAAALLGSTTLAACSGEGGESGEASASTSSGEGTAYAGEGEGEGATAAAYTGEGVGGEGEGGEGGVHEPETMSKENRLAFMRGHVEAGLALYRAGAPDEAARHLLHPVSETHAAEREGLDELGFKADLFVGISDALEAGTASATIETELTEAEENLAMLAGKVGGSDKDILNFLMDTTLTEYRIGVSAEGEIVNAGEFQDAYGFVTVAEDYAADIPGAVGDAVRTELAALKALWSGAPLANSTPASVDILAAQVSRVQLELSAIR